MKMQKRETSGLSFAKKGEDIKDGDIITFKDPGREIDTQFGKQTVFSAHCPQINETKTVPLNQTSINNMVDEYGEESEQWVEKKARVWMNRENVQGKFSMVMYLTAPHKDLDGNTTENTSHSGAQKATEGNTEDTQAAEEQIDPNEFF